MYVLDEILLVFFLILQIPLVTILQINYRNKVYYYWYEIKKDAGHEFIQHVVKYAAFSESDNLVTIIKRNMASQVWLDA